MAKSDVSAVVNYFATINEGFTTTISSQIASAATTIPLATTSGLTNASIFVGIIEPGLANQQVFTGVVDTGGSQITGVKWTRGTNVIHASGVTIVDYETGTLMNMITTGVLVTHNQDGTLKTSIVTTTKINNAAVTADKLGTGAVTARVSASETTTSTSYTDLSTTTDTVTAVIGANGMALVSLYCGTIQNDTSADYSLVAFVVSGANTIAAADSGANMFSLKLRNAAASVVGDWGFGGSQLLTGLTPGSTTFKMKYRVAVGGTGTFAERKISVVPL